MQGRRRETRFIPSTPWHAAFQGADDVSLESADGDEVWVLADAPCRHGEALTLEVATGGIQLNVRVMESEPVSWEGTTRHRMRLRIVYPDLGLLTGEPPAGFFDSGGGHGREH